MKSVEKTKRPRDGQRIFRFDTFGDEQVWTDMLRLHEVVEKNAYVAVTQMAGHAPYFHDGSAATLADVVAHYNRVRTLGLSAEQQREFVEHLKSL